MKNRYDILFIISTIFYFLSLFFNGYYEIHNENGVQGFFLVIFGFFFIFNGGASFTWLANPVIWLSWRYRKHINLSLFLSITASLTSLSFFLFNIGTNNQLMCCDTIITKIGIGYYLWILSIGTFTLRNYLKADIMKMRCEIIKITKPILTYILKYLDKFFKDTFPPKDNNY